MDCCGDDAVSPTGSEVGVVENRKCRDVIFLILFALFWVGMFIVCGIAVKEGDVNRLLFGLDSYGFLCGTENKYKNMTVDLSDKQNLYYLNPLELIDPLNYQYAKSICVRTCPAPSERCDPTKLPCQKNNQYRCPYYMLAPNNLYKTLNPGVNMLETAYYTSLASTRQTNCKMNIPTGIAPKLLESFVKRNTTMSCREYYQLTSQINQGPCYPVWASTASFLYRCYPDTSIDQLIGTAVVAGGNNAKKAKEGQDMVKKIAYTKQKSTQYLGDLRRGYEVLAIAGVGGGLVLALFWMLLLRFCVGLMVWLTVIAINVFIFGVMLFSYDKAGYLSKAGAVGNFMKDVVPGDVDPAQAYQHVWFITALVLTCVFLLVFLFTLVMMRRIAIAVATIKAASKCVAKMPSILLYPLLPFIFNTGLILYWVYITALLWSAGSKEPTYRDTKPSSALSVGQLYSMVYNTSAPTPSPRPKPATPTNLTYQERYDRCPTDPDCYFSYVWNDKLRYSFAYHVFGLLWTHQFILSTTYITLAGAVGYYYWTAGSPPALSVTRALKNTTFYHLGSAAFGGAIIAILQFMRLLLEYFYRSARQGTGDNWVLRWLCCCAQCVLWCVQKIMEFINKNAFIMIGVKGYGYCQASAAAVKLIMNNALRLAAVDIIADLMVFLGKISVATGCALLAFVVCNTKRYNDRVAHPDTFISTPLLLVVFSAVTGYIVADVFLAVYEVAVETIILAFCEDCEAHGGKPRYAPEELLRAINMKPREKRREAKGGKHHPEGDRDVGDYQNPVHRHNGNPHNGQRDTDPQHDQYDNGYDQHYKHPQRVHHNHQNDYSQPPSIGRRTPPPRSASPFANFFHRFNANNPDGFPYAKRASSTHPRR